MGTQHDRIGRFLFGNIEDAAAGQDAQMAGFLTLLDNPFHKAADIIIDGPCTFIGTAGEKCLLSDAVALGGSVKAQKAPVFHCVKNGKQAAFRCVQIS